MAGPDTVESPVAPQPPPSATDDGIPFNANFLDLPTFRMLVLADPILESFFDQDLSRSFCLEPVQPSSFITPPSPSDPNFNSHPTPAYPGAATGASGSGYSRDITTGARGAIGSFINRFLDDENKGRLNRFADEMGKRLEVHTVSPPRPSFGRVATLEGSRLGAAVPGSPPPHEQPGRESPSSPPSNAGKETLPRKPSFQARIANSLFGRGGKDEGSKGEEEVEPSPLSAAAMRTPIGLLRASSPSSSVAPSVPEKGEEGEEDAKELDSTSSFRPRHAKRASLNLSIPGAAAETLRAATEAINERSKFVIDEPTGPGEEDEDGDEEGIEAGVEERGDEEVMDEVERFLQAHGGDEAGLEGEDKKVAQDLKTAKPM